MVKKRIIHNKKYCTNPWHYEIISYQNLFATIMEADLNLQDTLNLIFAQPDLKDVFKYISPAMVKAHNWLTQDETTFFTELEDRQDVKAIVERELPRLFNLYCKYPLEYRNETLLRDGMTLRQKLVNDLQVLAGKINEIEDKQYNRLTRESMATSRVIAERYKSTLESGLEKEAEVPFKDTFSWASFKKDLPATNPADLAFYKPDNTAPVMNQKIRLREGQVQVQTPVSERMKKAANIVLYASTVVLKKMNKKRSFLIKSAIALGIVYIIGHVLAALGHSYMVEENLYEAGRYMSASSPEIREINKKVLKEFVSKREHMQVSFSADNKLAFVSEMANHKDCMSAIDTLHDRMAESAMPYRVNNVLLNTKVDVPEETAAMLCGLENNNEIAVSYLFRK